MLLLLPLVHCVLPDYQKAVDVADPGGNPGTGGREASSGVFEAKVQGILGDSNNDGKLSPGETGAVQIRIKNNGQSTVRAITGDLVTDAAGVSVVGGAGLQFGDVEAAAVSCGVVSDLNGIEGSCFGGANFYPKISLSPSVPAGSKISLALMLVDGSGGTFAVNLTYSTPGIDQSFELNNVSIVEDTNGDGKASPGETAAIKLHIRNAGNSAALEVVGDLSSPSAGVTLTSGGGLRFGDIPGADGACGVVSALNGVEGACFGGGSFYPKISLATSVKPGTQIPLVLTLKDKYGTTFSVSANYAVAEIDQSFAVVNVTVSGDASGDGRLSPGEAGSIQVHIRNNGSSKALGVTGSLSTLASGVTFPDGAVLKFGDVEPGVAACGVVPTLNGVAGSCFGGPTFYPRISVGSSVARGTSLPLTLTLTDTYGNRFVVSFSVVVS